MCSRMFLPVTWPYVADGLAGGNLYFVRDDGGGKAVKGTIGCSGVDWLRRGLLRLARGFGIEFWTRRDP